MVITGKSCVYGILGDPVAHSLSPLMQNYALQHHHIDAAYLPFHVLPHDLAKAVAGLRAVNVAGFNLTIPHKETIIPLLDQVDSEARLIGAVNTVVNDRGVLVGYNTDSSGFIRAVEQELNFCPKGRTVLLLGAGGACRAAAVALAIAGAKSIIIASRDQSRGARVVADLVPHFATVLFSVTSFNSRNYLQALSVADLIVNATPVGLHGEDIDILPLDNIKSSALIYDMIYSFGETPFVKVARLGGFVATDGLGMLAGQGEDAFFLWTGVRLPTGFMRKFLKKSQNMSD